MCAWTCLGASASPLGVGKGAWFSFLSRFPFFVLLVSPLLRGLVVFHIAVKRSALVSGVNAFGWKRLLALET